MVLQGVFAERDEEEASPAGVVVGVEIKGDGDECFTLRTAMDWLWRVATASASSAGGGGGGATAS